jgi:transcriptional regulator with XRE-family HTH domain
MGLDPKNVGGAIAELRKMRGLRQQDVAAKAGLTGNFLSLVENGQRAVSMDTLNRLAEVFRVPAEWIIFLSAETPRATKDRGLGPLYEATKEAIRAALAADNDR